MSKKVAFNYVIIILFAVILLASTHLSYANDNIITINVPNAQGGYTSLMIQKSGTGYLGPQGEYYDQFPSVTQLQVIYGLGAPGSMGATNTNVETITVPPPALPVYVRPDPPGPGYIWAPGYWAYSSYWEDYYWVPGTWVTAPYEGLLWTPGYWHWRNGFFVFSSGYWGAHIGFYGGINYGHGYGGRGFSGGSWNHGIFVNKTVNTTNVTNITNNTTNNNSSFNGGPGGTNAKPTFGEKAAIKEKHFPATPAQKLQVQTAKKNPALRASANHGKPAIAATAKPGVFKGKGVVPARRSGAFYNRTNASAKHAALLHHKSLSHVQTKPKPKHKPKTKPIVPAANGQNNSE